VEKVEEVELFFLAVATDAAKILASSSPSRTSAGS